MKTPNRFIDVNASTSKNAEKKRLSQRDLLHNEAEEERKVYKPKLSTNFSEKRGSHSSLSSHSNNHAEYSRLTKLANRYRALRHNYLMLKKENALCFFHYVLDRHSEKHMAELSRSTTSTTTMFLC